MAYNENLAQRVRQELAGHAAVTEKRMFGGLTFLFHRRMCCGVLGDDLVVRVPPEDYEKALTEPHTRPMDFTGRPLRGFVYVGPGGYKQDEGLREWLLKAVAFTGSLPLKKK